MQIASVIQIAASADAKTRGSLHQVMSVNRTALVALVLLTSVRIASASPATRCVVHGDEVTLEKLTVNNFTVGVVRVKADATITSDRPGVTVDVAGDIAFRATAPSLWFTVTTESRVGAGIVTMSPGAHLIGERLDGTGVAGAAVIYAADILQGEDKPAEETVAAVTVPCDHLSLDWANDPVAPPSAEGRGWRSRGASLTFHTTPRASAPSVTFASTSCEEECLNVRGDAAKNGYRRVSIVNQSVGITGWVTAGELTRIPDGEGFGYSYGCTGDHDRGGRLFGGAPPPTSYADLAAGTKIYDAPRGVIWATVTRKQAFAVRFAKGDTWAEVAHLPGISDPEGHAYVPVASLVNRRAKP